MKNLNELSKRIDELKKGSWRQNTYALTQIELTLKAMLGELTARRLDFEEYKYSELRLDIQKLIDKINNQKGGEQK